MSKSGVPWAGIVMTSVVFVFGSVLNALTPDAFEIALEATSVMILFTWGTIFACQLRLRQLTDRGVIPQGSFQAPGYPYTRIIGLVFLVLVLVGLAISGWQASPYFLHKTSFLVVVFGIPVLAGVLAIGWRAVKPKVVANTGDKIKAVWTLDGPTYGDVTPDDLDPKDDDRDRLSPHHDEKRTTDAQHPRRTVALAPWPPSSPARSPPAAGGEPIGTPTPVPGASTGGKLDHRHLLRPARPRPEGRRQLHRLRRRHRDLRGHRRSACPRRTSPGRRPTPPTARTCSPRAGRPGRSPPTPSPTSASRRSTSPVPYFMAHQDLLVRRNEEEITGPDTLNGRVLCSVTGTTSAEHINKQYKGKINLKEFPKFSDCVAALADSESTPSPPTT